MYHPTFKQLKYLVSIAQNLHFGKAAHDCFVSQSTLSSGIQELEKLLNIKLIERTKRKVLLTPIGKQVTKNAQNIILEMNDVLDYAKSAQGFLCGEIKLGIIPTIAPYILPKLMRKIRQKYPKLELKLIEDQTANILQKLYQGYLDIVIIARPYKVENLKIISLKKDYFFAAFPENSPLNKINKNSLTSHDISKNNMLLLDEGHCLRDHVLQACDTKTKANVDAFKATSLLTLVQMVSNGAGITLLPELVINSELLKNSKIKIKDYENRKNYREIVFVYRESSPRTKDFTELGNLFINNI